MLPRSAVGPESDQSTPQRGLKFLRQETSVSTVSHGNLQQGALGQWMGKLNRRIFLPQAVWTVPQPRCPTAQATTHIPAWGRSHERESCSVLSLLLTRGPLGVPWIGAPGEAPLWGALSLPQPCPWSLSNFQEICHILRSQEPTDVARTWRPGSLCPLPKSHQKKVWSHSRHSILFLLKNKYL